MFQLQNVRRNDDSETTDVKVITKNDSMVRNPKYTNPMSGVELLELRETLNRFRLTGPMSNAVLLKALKPTSHFDGNWLGNLFDDDPKFQQAHEEQNRLLKQLQEATSPSELPPHIILGLNIVDPRTNRPAKREKAVSGGKTFNDGDYLEVPVAAAVSGIWSKKLRDGVTTNMMPSGELCKLRNAKQLVPGVASSFEQTLQPVPLLLIQRPGSGQRSGFASGWDVVIPAGYGLSVWLSLIRCGAKSGGWREAESVASEMNVELFAPDTVSGWKESDRQVKLKRDEYFRKPPNKRTNFVKMGIASPFSCPYSQLVAEWNGTGQFHVLRDRAMLHAIEKNSNLMDLKVPADALIPINVRIESRGVPGDFGIVCLPSKRDIKNFLVQRHQRDHRPVHVEPAAKDDAEMERKLLRADHKKLLTRLRNRRVRTKRKLQATANSFVKIQKSSAEKTIQEHYERMCELWLPKKPATVRHQCSRQVFGYLSSSRFNLSEGKVSGVGHVTKDGLASLLEVFKKFKGLKPFVLTRATNSRSYQPAAISVRIYD